MSNTHEALPIDELAIIPASKEVQNHTENADRALGFSAINSNVYNIPGSLFPDSPMGKEAASLEHFGVDSASQTSNVTRHSTYRPIDAFVRDGSSNNND